MKKPTTEIFVSCDRDRSTATNATWLIAQSAESAIGIMRASVIGVVRNLFMARLMVEIASARKAPARR